KWLKLTRTIPWRRPIASLNYLLSSHVWRQDHNGFSHQDPGFIDHVVNKKAEVIRVYLAPDANCLLSVADHCLRSRNYVNVIVADLMRLQQPTEHPHGLRDAEFDEVFTRDRPVIFAYHGYPWLIHRLTYRRTNHPNIHVRGYKEEGTTTTPFDMVMLNDLDRYHLVMDVIDRVPSLGSKAAHVRQEMVDHRLRSRQHTRHHGQHPPEPLIWV